uniref:C2H2-type domain-containing protein n=1 Tax=Timema genevievae TaxID=629358 RepID=A0A7R9K7J2_TIMGE|nr:unnamed protein product [Timema genevievae]
MVRVAIKELEESEGGGWPARLIVLPGRKPGNLGWGIGVGSPYVACMTCHTMCGQESSDYIDNMINKYWPGPDDSFLKCYGEENGNYSPRYACNRCGKVYKWQASLKSHQRRECGKEPRFKCDLCPYKTHRKSNITRHTMLWHSSALPCKS